MLSKLELKEYFSPSINSILETHLQEALRCDHPSLWLYLVRTLAKGKPVTQTSIAIALGMSLNDIQTALTTFKDIEYDGDQNLIACGLSLSPTPHCFQVNGQNLFTWCALDALMYPVALNQTAQVKSHCPVTGIEVRLTVTSTGVTFLIPTEAVVSIVIPTDQAGCCNIRNAFCSQVLFINSPQTAYTWCSKHPEATILSVEEAWRLGYAIAQRRLADEQLCGASVM